MRVEDREVPGRCELRRARPIERFELQVAGFSANCFGRDGSEFFWSDRAATLDEEDVQ